MLSGLAVRQRVPVAVHGVNDLGGSFDSNLLTQSIDVDLDQITFAVEVSVPHMLHDLARLPIVLDPRRARV